MYNHTLLHQTPHQRLIAFATIHLPPTQTAKRQIQSQEVRALLTYYLDTLDWLNGYSLRADKFPYQLLKDNCPPLFVCFSHSQTQVALMIDTAPCGIDIELRAVNLVIAKRFFHRDEWQFLQTTPQALQTLWQIKECLAKLENRTLSQTLGENCLSILKGERYRLWRFGQIVALGQ